MGIRKTTLISAGLTGWVGVLAMRAMNRYAARQLPKVPKAQMHTWEGEGGNLPPQQLKAPL